jgi:hypothetical protein
MDPVKNQYKYRDIKNRKDLLKLTGVIAWIPVGVGLSILSYNLFRY